MDTTDNVKSYISIMRALMFDEDGPSIPIGEYSDRFTQVFDLTSTQEATVQPDVVAASFRFELFFTCPVPSASVVAVSEKTLNFFHR